jgi:hypothetical protein
MFKTCFSKCLSRNHIYYEIPASRTTNINYHGNVITNYNVAPPIPPRRCRKIKNSLGELIPLSSENICILQNNVDSSIGNPIYNKIPAAFKSVTSTKSLYLPTKKSVSSLSDQSNSKRSSSVSLPDLKMVNDDWFNMQLANDYFAKNNLQKEKYKDEIEPLFTVDINIKNERNGVVSHRKIFM